MKLVCNWCGVGVGMKLVWGGVVAKVASQNAPDQNRARPCQTPNTCANTSNRREILTGSLLGTSHFV